MPEKRIIGKVMDGGRGLLQEVQMTTERVVNLGAALQGSNLYWAPRS